MAERVRRVRYTLPQNLQQPALLSTEAKYGTLCTRSFGRAILPSHPRAEPTVPVSRPYYINHCAGMEESSRRRATETTAIFWVDAKQNWGVDRMTRTTDIENIIWYLNGIFSNIHIFIELSALLRI